MTFRTLGFLPAMLATAISAQESSPAKPRKEESTPETESEQTRSAGRGLRAIPLEKVQPLVVPKMPTVRTHPDADKRMLVPPRRHVTTNQVTTRNERGKLSPSRAAGFGISLH